MGHENARPRATLAGKISTIAVSSLYPSIPFGNSRARHSNLASPDRLASVPFWSHPNVLEFTLERVQLGWRPDRSEGPVESARSSSPVEAEKLREMVGKENSRVKWQRVRNSRAVALYDDGSFTRKSQCSATVLAACRNVHPLTFSVRFSPIS